MPFWTKTDSGVPQEDKRTLYVHIGAHRTATTSIQAFLNANHAPLKAKGYLVPFGTGRHMDQLNGLLNGRVSPEDFAADLTRRAESHPETIHSIVLSDEDVAKRHDLSKLARLGRHFDVKIIYALRRQDLWLESWWSQNVKGQWDAQLANKTFDDFIRDRGEFHWIDYDAFVGRLEKQFGAENINLFVFERESMPEGVAGTFCRAMGLSDMSGLRDAPRQNGSMTPQISEVMRQLPLTRTTQAFRQHLVAAFAQADRTVRAMKLPQLILTHKDRTALMAGYAAGNDALARRRFGRDTLFLEPMPAADAPVADLALPSSGDVMMEMVLRPFVEGLMEIEASRAAAGPKKKG
ncbi:hypothetical protein [Falsirhodobacter algicola]|uniref:Sulfotransferase family protein n=1 Tax=Falsirhodobacter algicola TaxID=2692330 RepID=A0A8J8MSU6_9RHOB|nr:hypothetical protein [Falsirhodobacter algicola]QUS36091.1 hypothetical protein GR316_07295 [Falsirhodobacter algicola]